MTASQWQNRTKRKTCRRYNVPGDAHALTFSCFKRRAFLARDRSRRWFMESLDAARTKHAFDVWAYVLMPEHVHLLIFPRASDYSISDILTDIKQPVTRWAFKYLQTRVPDSLSIMRDEQPSGKMAHRFWQRGGGYDRNLTKPKTIHATIDYIHTNPVRRELVDAADDWYWSSARYHMGRTDVPLVPDVGSIPLLGPTDN